MASDCGPQAEICFQHLALAKTVFENSETLLRQLLQHQVLRVKDEHIDLDREVRGMGAKIAELRETGQDNTGLLTRVKEMGEKLKRITRQLPREVRKNPVAFDDIKPFIDEFMTKTRKHMELMLVHNERERTQSIPNLPPSPAANEDDDNYNDAPFDLGNDSLPCSPRPALRSPPSSKRTSPDSAEDRPSPKRRAHRHEITTAEIDEGFSNQKITETPARSGEWYVFQCQEHDLPLDSLARPAQAAARHAIAHGLQSTHASAIEAFGIRIAGCQVNSATVDRVYRPRHGRGNDGEMAERVGDVNPSNPRHVPVRRAAATRKRTILSRDPDGTENPAEITAKTIYWIKWPDDGICYPASVLPWESFPRFRIKYLVPADRGLLESVDELPACYDKGHGFAGVWAEGYKDGQRKMNKRLYPVIFFTLERRFPWECETGWAAAQDFRVFDGDNEDPQFKALVDHWLAREDRQTPDEELIRLNRGSSSSSSSDRKSSPEEPPENRDIDEELRKAFVDLTECLSSDQGSSREESPDSDDDESDIGNALLRDASSPSQRARAPDDGTPAGRPNPDEDEDSDIYGDDNVGPFPDKSPIKESDTASSRHDLEESSVRSREFSDPIDERTTIPPSDDEYSLGRITRADATGDEEDEEDSLRLDEPSTARRRVGSSEQRVRQAMASAAHQTNAVWRDILREYSEEADELSS
ncbi:hypothetical protein FOPG_10828 [Fusarium oxysporum f. sp. conglutinans race 2 54008]|uniref:Uncharacterized protein n=1 Tax=Fusarium oxysporum f. sp. conglutinans race 2 54008 TaxID=1089457 RepID=X0ILN5_FUSOX|nr:hypothetical protein FOPG_10828 [Fusarium oxysporum f. sp. conglutinans race 2 54008]